MQATAEPHIQDGRITGFKLTQIDDDSIFSKSGFRNEDIVTAINGKNLSNIATAINILKSLKNSEFVEFDVIRGGNHQTISLTVQ
jgi:type II secretory pathway component PulC